MEMKQCQKCGVFKDINTYPINKNRGKLYVVNICRSCYNERSRGYIKKEDKNSPILKQYRNAIIRENDREYITNQLVDSEIVELKELGYGFIFRA